MSATRRRKLIYIVSVSVLLAGTAVAMTIVMPRRDPVAAAEALQAAGRTPEALDRYQDVLARDPNNARALWGVAQIHLARHDPAMAVEYLNRYLQRAPKGPHAAEARQALAQARGSFSAAGTPSPELVPPPTPALTPAVPLVDQWTQALDLEGRGDYLNAVTAYAGLAQTSQDGRVRAACLERIARCEARRPPFDYERIRHYYLEASRAYRELNDAQNSARCQELAYLAQEYARVEAERKKLADEERVADAKHPKPEEKQPTPEETYAAASEALRTGNDAKAEAEARKVKGTLAEADYVLGLVHLHEGLWDDAREELESYLKAAPRSASAGDARAQLASIQGKRLVFQDSFRSGAAKWQLTDAAPGTAPATETPAGAEAGGGPCLKVEPGKSAYTSFEEARIATVEIRFYEPPDTAPQVPPVSVRLYSKSSFTCAPLLLTRKGYRFASQGVSTVRRSPGWHRLVIDVSDEVVSAQLDGQSIGEAKREGGLSGVSFRADQIAAASALYVSEVRVVEHQ